MITENLLSIGFKLLYKIKLNSSKKNLYGKNQIYFK